MNPGGARTIVAENLLLKQQLLVACRSRQRAPRLSVLDRLLFGFWSLFLYARRMVSGRHHPKALYSAPISRGVGPAQVSSAVHPRQPNETGSQRTLASIDPRLHVKDGFWSVDLFRCESIRLQTHWVLMVMDQFTWRIIGFAVQAGDVDGRALCRMFNQAISQQGPQYLSSVMILSSSITSGRRTCVSSTWKRSKQFLKFRYRIPLLNG